MTIKEAVQKAVEGGYEKNRMLVINTKGKPYFEFAKAVLDLLFWQSFGKAMRWKESVSYFSKHCIYDNSVQDMMSIERASVDNDEKSNYEKTVKNGGRYECEGFEFHIYQTIPEWKLQWHSFIDHLAEGGRIEFFFEKL